MLCFSGSGEFSESAYVKSTVLTMPEEPLDVDTKHVFIRFCTSLNFIYEKMGRTISERGN